MVHRTGFVALPCPVERLADRRDALGAKGAAATGGARAEDVGVVGVVGTDNAVVALGGTARGDGRAWAVGDGDGGVVVTAAEEFRLIVIAVVATVGLLFASSRSCTS
jgi:hypothetical protein